MSVELNLHKNENIISSKANEGFSNSWIFNVPIDLGFSHKFPDTNKKEDILSDKIYQNYLTEDLINTMSNLNTNLLELEPFLDIKNKNEIIKNNILTRTSRTTSRFFSTSFNQNNEDKNSSKEESKFLSHKEDKRKVEEKINNSYQKIKSFNSKNSLLDKKINNSGSMHSNQNYYINVYNPNINCVNICYPPVSYPLSSFPQDNNQIFKENFFILNKEELAGKLPMNLNYENYENSSNINRNIFFNKENNINFFINRNINNNLGDNFPAYSSGSENKIFIKNNCIKENQNTKIKKKRKKKKKIEDEYTVEMFGRRGWICEECYNFNYQTRKKCNRCKIPKKPFKKTVIVDNEGNKIVDNIMKVSHKGYWKCHNCGNINYAFRLNCNRCQIKRDDDYETANNKINKLEN